MSRKRTAAFLYGILALCFGVLLAAGAQASVVTASPYRATIPDYDEAYEILYQAASAGEEGADLSSCRLTQDELLQLYSDLIGSAPELFYLDNKIQYYCGSQAFSRTVLGVEFCYTMSAEQIKNASAAYRKELTEIVKQVDRSLSDAEMALWVHDYLISSFSFDTGMKNYDAYSLLRDRKGVCQAYSLAYAAILRELGMEAVMISSPSKGHAWNLVKIDGSWYHVDLVTDDPSPDVLGQVLHENFLLSDWQIRETSDLHAGWNSSIPCEKSITDPLWQGVRSRMLRADSRWFYVDPKTASFTSSRFNGEGRVEIYSFRDRWKVADEPGKSWVGTFSGVSEYQGCLFINTPYEILIYDPAEMRTGVYLEAGPGEQIFGSAVYRDLLEYRIAASPADPNAAVRSVTIPEDLGGNAGKQLPFTDVSRSDSFYGAVHFVYEKGLFQGVSASRFAPEATLTRAMFVTVLGRLSGVDPAAFPGTGYADVPAGQWYSPYVSWASENGIVNGFGGGLFKPMGEITRAQMFKIAAFFGQKMGIGETPASDRTLDFADGESLPEWARESVSYCAANSLLDVPDGGSLRHSQPATRAEAAQIIARIAQMMAQQNGGTA